jgi:uncharacterized protein YkwD
MLQYVSVRRLLTVWTAVFAFLVGANGLAASSTDLATKAEILMALIETRIVDVPNVENTGAFPDVPKGDHYEKYLIIAEKYGIIDADPKTGNLFPARPVTRAELLRMLAYTYGLPTGQVYLYKDIFSGDWYAEYAGIAQKYDLFLPEKGGTLLRPGKLVTRREAVQVISKVLRVTSREQKEQQEIARIQAEQKMGTSLVTSSTREKAIVSKEDVHASGRSDLKEGKQVVTLRAEVLKLVNAERRKKGMPGLSGNSALDRSAQAYAQDIATQGFFSHVSPTGETLRDRVLGTGFINLAEMSACNCLLGYAFAENLASGQKTPQDVVKAWMKSKGHRENILNNLFTDLGIGIYGGVWVQHFGGILTPEE